MRYRLLLFAASLILAACGTVAEPRPTFEPTNTALPRAANIADETETEELDSGETETEVALEATALPPTVTPAPTVEATAVPTEVPTEEATEEAIEAVTEEATEEHTDDHAHTEEATEEVAEAATEEETGEEAPAEVVVNGLTGDAEVGDFWFHGGVEVTYNNTVWQCSTCHNVEEPLPGNGPFLYGIANHAGEHGAEEGLDAVEYLTDSIINPRHIIAPPQVGPDGTEYVWQEDLMPDNWETVLDDQMLADLVAYLMTLTQEVDAAAHEHN